MTESVLKALKELGVSDYLINHSLKSEIELYFIKKKLDLRRRKDTEHLEVTVFVDFMAGDKPMRGSSAVNIFPGMTDEEIKASLRSAKLAAGFVKNPAYPLPAGEKHELINNSPELDTHSLEDITRIMTEALFAEDNNTDAFLNSAEMYVSETVTTVISSEGSDVSWKKLVIRGEFVAQCKKPQDVETYQSFRYTRLSPEALRTKVRNALERTRARAIASEAPVAGNYRVILSDAYMSTFFEYYLPRTTAEYIYPGYSNFKVGDMMQGKDVTGDLVTVDMIPEDPYSNEGIPMKARRVMENGVLTTITGAARCSSYIGTEPTGHYNCIKVAAGSMSFEDMKKEPVLHVVNFSDFQMNDFDGHFGGEIRLAFLIEGDKVTPVTGGSINGSIFEVQKNMFFSKEMQEEDGYEGPLAVLLENVPVAGISK